MKHPAEYTSTVKVQDNFGFYHEGSILHSPWFGYSHLFYKDETIDHVSSYILRQPIGDDDREWEVYWEHYGEWSGAVQNDLELSFKIHVNNLLK